MKLLIPALLALLLASCSGPSDPPFQEYKAGDGLFTIQGPGAPTKSSPIKEFVPPHGNITGNQYEWLPPSNRYFMAMYMVLPPALAGQDLEKAMKNMAAGVSRRAKGAITGERSVVMNGLPAKEYELKLEANPGGLRMRTFERSGTLYLLATGWQEGRKKELDEERFFDSFTPKL